MGFVKFADLTGANTITVEDAHNLLLVLATWPDGEGLREAVDKITVAATEAEGSGIQPPRAGDVTGLSKEAAQAILDSLPKAELDEELASNLKRSLMIFLHSG